MESGHALFCRFGPDYLWLQCLPTQLKGKHLPLKRQVNVRVIPLTSNLRNEVRKPHDGFRCGRERSVLRDFPVLQQ
jgi:hypothetical protein